jgi:colanic acid/amylovoran biosynthesis protein
VRALYGVVLDREVDVVLDASGFFYSDQFGVEPIAEFANSVRRWRRQGAKVILLPQAFGPFTSRIARGLMRTAMEGVELAFARDEQSREHLANIVVDPSRIRLAPDFTNLIAGTPPPSGDYREHVCVIPNARMMDKTSSDTAAAYPSFLIGAVRTLRDLGRESFLLVHEGPKDEALAEEVAKAVRGIDIVRESDPLRIKGIIGASYASVGSRFHGLVSSLSQGVPCIGTGWSHKYAELFSDYGAADMIVDVRAEASSHRQALARLADAGERDRMSRALVVASNRLKELAREMWEQVFESIGPRTGRRF